MRYQHFHDIDSNPKTNPHLAEIIDSISANGWQGLPLLACGEQLYNGCHRATACEILDVEPDVHQMQLTAQWGDSDYIDTLLCDLSDASNTRAVLAALEALLVEELVDAESVEIMRAERG